MTRKSKPSSLPPFDLVFCRDADQEILFVVSSESTKDSLQGLFPDLLLDKHDLGWVDDRVTRARSAQIAFEATKAGFKVAFGEHRDGMVTFQPVEICNPS